MTTHSAGEPLPPDVHALLSEVARVLPPSTAAVLQAQCRAAEVVTCSPRMVDVFVPHDMQRLDERDGPLPVTAIVSDEQGNESGEILVWVKQGMLLGIEQTWFTDEPPEAWPSIERVKLS